MTSSGVDVMVTLTLHSGTVNIMSTASVIVRIASRVLILVLQSILIEAARKNVKSDYQKNINSIRRMFKYEINKLHNFFT